MAPIMKTIKLTGPFSDTDIFEFVALLRRIDEANPASVYAITVTDPDLSMDEAERFVSSLLPPLPDRTTTFARASYRDDSFPERECDNCGKNYRGPAVYCSFECAIADA
jgi:hypothetical protein